MGCFDLLHHGHLEVLKEAKRQCDHLIVGLATDDTVEAVKGEGRPVVGYADRYRMLSEMRCVDDIRSFSLASQAQVVLEIMPHICFAGKDGNPRLQEILNEFQLGLEVKKLDCEVIHTTDLLRRLSDGGLL